jgi:glycosyltransferase involved in cell wall biosynthesis
VAALVAAAKRLLNDPALREQYGQAGFDRVNQIFSKEKMISNVVAVYQNVLRQHKPAQ